MHFSFIGFLFHILEGGKGLWMDRSPQVMIRKVPQHPTHHGSYPNHVSIQLREGIFPAETN